MAAGSVGGEDDWWQLGFLGGGADNTPSDPWGAGGEFGFGYPTGRGIGGQEYFGGASTSPEVESILTDPPRAYTQPSGNDPTVYNIPQGATVQVPGGVPPNRNPPPPMPGSAGTPPPVSSTPAAGTPEFDLSVISETPQTVLPSGMASSPSSSTTTTGAPTTTVTPPGGTNMDWINLGIQGAAAAGSYFLNRNASRDAQGALTDSANYATDIQNQQYLQNRSDFAPWMDAGSVSLDEQRKQLGLPAYSPSTSQYSGTTGHTGGGTIDASTFPRTGAANEGMVRQAFNQFAGREPTQYELSYYMDRARASELYNDVVARGYLPGVEPPQAPQSQEFLGGSEANPEEGRYGAYLASPGYQWLQDETMRAVDAGMSSSGRFFSGPRDKARARYGAGVAQQDYQSYVRNLQSLSGGGGAAVSSLSDIGSRTANQIAGNTMFGGGARASGILDRGRQRGDLFSTLGTIASDWWENR